MDQHHLDPGLANEVSLELYTIASQLERFSIDNGPHGESTPFSSESKRLRHGAISRLEKERDALQTVMEAAISDASQWKTIAQEREKEILLLRSVLRRG